jgi:hypothetical protein
VGRLYLLRARGDRYDILSEKIRVLNLFKEEIRECFCSRYRMHRTSSRFKICGRSPHPLCRVER